MFFPCNYYDCCCYFVIVVAGRFISILFSFFAFLVFFFESRVSHSRMCVRIFPQNTTNTHKKCRIESQFFFRNRLNYSVSIIISTLFLIHTLTLVLYLSLSLIVCFAFRLGYLVYHLEVYDILHNRFFLLLFFFFFFFVFIFLLRTFCLFFAYSNAPYVL